MIVARCNVLVAGELSDVHARTAGGSIAFCAVYQRPNGPVPGYWYFPAPQDARTLLTALGCLS